MLRNVAERAFVHACSSPVLSRPAGWLADRRLPRPLLRALIAAYARAYRVDLAEAARAPAEFESFNAFFTRRLRPGARPLDARDQALLSPCDARLQAWGRVPDDGRLEQIKGRDYSVAALLASEDDARLFRGGMHATLYLSPAMYHRVHAPADGHVVAWRYVPGRLFPVNGPAVRQVDGLFARNERVVVRLDSPRFGPLAVVLVGAANVGRISLAFAGLRTNSGAPGCAVTPDPAPALRRGDELGAFNLGSTVVLLAADRSLAPAGPVLGELVRMGQALWTRP
jgi:phosphatidylserine decarboxylase